MAHKSYKEEKEAFDNQVFSYLMKRLFEDYDESDACHEDVIDSIGNVIGSPDEKSQWSYTMFDQFVNMVKQNIGSDNMREMFVYYMHMRDIDPLFIIKNSAIDYKTLKPILGNIATKVNDKSYLPEYLYHESEYVEDDEMHNDELLNFADQVSKALTIATFLLYTLRRNHKLIGEDFPEIIESVESTFNMRSFGDFNYTNDFCKKHGLIDNMGITDEGIRLVVAIAKDVCDSPVLNSDGNGRHNHRHSWNKLGKVKK